MPVFHLMVNELTFYMQYIVLQHKMLVHITEIRTSYWKTFVRNNFQQTILQETFLYPPVIRFQLFYLLNEQTNELESFAKKTAYFRVAKM